jgi:hypothetical protein
MASALVRGRYVVTGVERGRAVVVEDGAVWQRDGVVVEVGPATDLARRHPGEETLGSADHVVLPGFVNSHHHVGLTPFQLGSPDHPLELWFASRMAARDVDPYLDTLYGDMLQSGITTVQHLHGWRGAPAARVLGVAERILHAYHDVGMRVSYSYALRDQNRLVYEADEAFCRRLPPAPGAELAEYLTAQTIPPPDHPRGPRRGAGRAVRRAAGVAPSRGGAAAAPVRRDLSSRAALLRGLARRGPARSVLRAERPALAPPDRARDGRHALELGLLLRGGQRVAGLARGEAALRAHQPGSAGRNSKPASGARAAPSSRSGIVITQDDRRSSPSVMTSRPAASCSAMASRTAVSSAARSAPAVTRPSRAPCRASRR